MRPNKTGGKDCTPFKKAGEDHSCRIVAGELNADFRLHRNHMRAISNAYDACNTDEVEVSGHGMTTRLIFGELDRCPFRRRSVCLSSLSVRSPLA